MKTILKISILLNAILLGGLMFIWTNPRKEVAALPSAMTKAEPQSLALDQSTPSVVRTEVESKSFSWSQLLSKNNDYRAFVANLRAAGCPEPTVEDIVRGDAERVFFAKRGELQLDGSDPGPWSAQSQMQLVAYLLGKTPAAAQEVAIAASPSSPAERRKRPLPEWPVTIPVAMQSIDPAALTALNLSDDQKQLIADVQRTLMMRNMDPAALNPNDGQKQMVADASQSSPNQAGSMSQNPQDPASFARSQQEAQMEADTTLQASLGSQGYLGYKLAEEQTALENQLMSHPNWVLVDPQW
jgi:hypothetical protein